MPSVAVTRDPAYSAGATALLIAIATILAAHAFERFGNFPPCPLCLMQRWAYYAAIPALFGALIAYAAGRATTAGLLFFAVALAFLANAGLGVYHAGAEWGFWPGPETCSGGPGVTTGGGGGILGKIEGPTPVVRCDKAPWTFLGLSFAGWNVVVSLVAFAATLKAAFDAAQRR